MGTGLKIWFQEEIFLYEILHIFIKILLECAWYHNE